MSFKKKTIAVLMMVCMIVTMITASTTAMAEEPATDTGNTDAAASQNTRGTADGDMQDIPEENNQENAETVSPENENNQETLPGTENEKTNTQDEENTQNKTPENYITITKKIKKSILVQAKANGRGRIIVRWSVVSKSGGYKVYRAVSKNGKYKRVHATQNWKKRRWTDKSRKLRRNRTYYYKVLPQNRRSLVKHKKIRIRAKEKNVYKASMLSLSARADSNKARVTNKLRAKRSMRVRATAYSGGGRCANGMRVGVGRIAVDPRVISLGSWVYVDGYGLAQACDTGGAIKGKRIDLYFNSEGQCERYGVRSTKLFVLR